ncbi:hypothetical protein Tco_1571926, partial [Tanacetum coccineum]
LKNVIGISTIDKMKNDGFQMVVNKRKSGKTGSTINNRSGAVVGKVAWHPIKQKGGFHVPTSKPSVPTSNPYDVLDDMESDEEVEVVYDETVNLNDTRTRASPSMDRDGSNI